VIVNDKSKELIKRFEGKRLKAYRCSAGVLTIGYGHTSMAGLPKVTPGMTITAAECDAIFDRDIERFAAKVESLITVDIGDNQFGACVSLAYNIGVGAFAKSSVLRFLNKGQFNDAADAFALFNKGGGRVLPGLVSRRAAEAALFQSDDVSTEDLQSLARIPDMPKGKLPLHSQINLGAGVTAAAGVSAAAKEITDNTHSILSDANLVMFALIAIILGGAGWIIYQRYLKARDWAI
jgi:lysozyme